MTDQAHRDRAAPAGLPARRAGWTKPKSWAFSNDPDVLIGQYANLKRQVPLLYLLLVIIALASIYLMLDAVPLLIVGGVAGFFVLVGTMRMAWWLWFLPAPDAIPVAEARKLLRRTTLAVIPICLSFLGYACRASIVR